LSDPLSIYNEKELLQRLAAGDGEAFNIIYRRYNSMVFRAAMTYLKDEDSAADIVQQVFLKVWEKKDWLLTVGSFQDYIVVSSRNLIYDQFRQKNREAGKILELVRRKGKTGLHDHDNQVEDREYARLLHLAVELLPPQQKKIYQLVEDEQLSYEEAASVTGLSKLTIKKHLELARRFVRNHVTEYLRGIPGKSK
jgi:RNA polymerase sigma factor (sigma-70 family)